MKKSSLYTKLTEMDPICIFWTIVNMLLYSLDFFFLKHLAIFCITVFKIYFKTCGNTLERCGIQPCNILPFTCYGKQHATELVKMSFWAELFQFTWFLKKLSNIWNLTILTLAWTWRIDSGNCGDATLEVVIGSTCQVQWTFQGLTFDWK